MDKWWEKQEKNNFEDFRSSQFDGKDEFYRFVCKLSHEISIDNYYGRSRRRGRTFYHKHLYNKWRNRFFSKSYRLLSLTEMGEKRFPFDIFMKFVSPVTSTILPIIATPREGSEFFDIHLFLGFVQSKNSYVTFGGWNCIIPNANEKCLIPNKNLYDSDACESATRCLVEGLSAETLTQIEVNPNIEKIKYPNKIIESYSFKSLEIINSGSILKYGPPSPAFKHCFLIPIEIDLDETKSELLDSILFQENEKGKWMKFSNFATLKIDSRLFDELRMGHKKKEDFINGEGFFQMKCEKKLKLFQQKLRDEPPVFVKGCFTFIDGDFDDARVGMKRKDLGEEKFSHFDFSGVSEVQRNGEYKLDAHVVMEILAFEEELKEIERVGLRNFKCIAKVEL